jgi:hypothetical protein
MIHIVFQQADIDVLKKAFELDETMAGDIVEIKDDYAVGPIQNIYETEGYQQRREWWKGLLDYSPYNSDGLMEMVDDRMAVHQLKRSLDEDEKLEVWIWMGQNQHDVCGYYWLISQLKEYSGRIYVLYLNNLPFINDKGSIFYPTTLHQILPKEFLKAKKLCRKVTSSEFEIDPDEWKKICNENAMVRILEGGKKIAGKDADFYDKELMQVLTADFQKLGKLLQQLFSKLKVKTGDVFLVWRLRQMINEGKLEVQGDWNKGWKEIEIRKKSEQSETVNAE